MQGALKLRSLGTFQTITLAKPAAQTRGLYILHLILFVWRPHCVSIGDASAELRAQGAAAGAAQGAEEEDRRSCSACQAGQHSLPARMLL